MLSTHDITVYVIDILSLDLYVFDVVRFSVMKLDYLGEVISEAIFLAIFWQRTQSRHPCARAFEFLCYTIFYGYRC